MEIITIVLAMLFAVVVSSWLARMSPVASLLPLIQIVLGTGLGLVAGLRAGLDPQVFFHLFLPPLLFLDGWRIPNDGLLRDKGTILALAFGLVVFTVIGVGFFVHWMIPAMPLAVAFALAAVLSPTDPLAVSAIAERVPVPNRLLRILQGESLLNDASGLVCLRFAIVAALTGSFSPSNASVTFLWLLCGGVATGFATTWVAAAAKRWVAQRFGEDTGSQILISLLMPFAAYITAEHLGCSGILAAVAAGVTMSYVESSGQALALTRIRRGTVWDMAQLALNGIVFVLLGEQLPAIVIGAAGTVQESGHHHPGWLAIYVVAICAALLALRFVWVWTSVQFTLFRPLHGGGEAKKPSWRLVAAMSFAGVRGAITMAGALTLPLVTSDGSAFPARDLAIFLAAGVIVVSLVVANIVMPALLKGVELPLESSHQDAEERARTAAAEAAIRAIQHAQHKLAEGPLAADIYADVASNAIESYRRRIDGLSQTGEAAVIARATVEIKQKLHLEGLKAERDEIFRMARSKTIDDHLARLLVLEIDRAETHRRARPSLRPG